MLASISGTLLKKKKLHLGVFLLSYSLKVISLVIFPFYIYVLTLRNYPALELSFISEHLFENVEYPNWYASRKNYYYDITHFLQRNLCCNSLYAVGCIINNVLP